MSTLYAFLSSHPQLSIIQDKKSWVVHVDALILSADGGNLYDALIIAARAALWDLKIPRTKGTGYETAPNLMAEEEDGMDRDVDMAGFSALLKGHKRGKGNEIDFELDCYWDEGDPLQDRELFPVSVTLNLVCHRRAFENALRLKQTIQSPYLDANRQEEEATSSRLLVAVNGRGNICNMRQDGHGEIGFDALDGFLDVRQSS